ncbi:arginine--tRNA ligase [Proteiniclasticum sp. SCR006]|uniref:Arginine--tRNA ligase n=1 Tax=Proteiniclasticum aestuarii TaxID=2817862 RepID=A0A939KG19_9CLOT|nr:arginine--tRNA ligase [Proteiniclasticum aestuarii]MBO1263894.1 arginine--tRNA ligase [Proteiniclasticum aestuarii]
MDYKKLIADSISSALEIEAEDVLRSIEIPPKQEMGDFAFPCFQLAKTLRKAPNMIAVDLKEKLDIPEIERVEVMGPYVNFFLNKSIYLEGVVKKVLEEQADYGSSESGEGKTVIVEYSSPNIAKPFHVGHLFTTVIGNSLSRIFKFQGFHTERINHLGDWGTQFGKLISGYERWVDKEKLQKSPIEELNRIYVKFHEEAEKDPSLDDEARQHFKNLEDGKEYEYNLWKEFRELSLMVFERVYRELGVEFDSYAGESFYGDKMDEVVDILEEKGILTESNGAKVVMLDDYNMPPTIIKKADGATIYATRDLAAAIYRKRTYDFHKNIYVVGTPQALHFKQVFKTLSLAGFEWADDCVHVGFGLVKFPGKMMSSRKGDVVLLDDLLKEAVVTAEKIIHDKNPNLADKENVARKVGIGAIIFTYLKNSREKDIIFNWDEILSFDGETGPYVQYTYARAKSILRKNEKPEQADLTLLSTQEEFELSKTLEGFGNAVKVAMEKYEPSVITRYVLQVAKDFNKFYNNCQINSAEAELKKARLQLVEATTIVIRNALELLGIETVEEM